MCLCLNKRVITTEQLQEQMKNGKRKFYKVYLDSSDKVLISPYQASAVRGRGPGAIVSNRKGKDLTVYEIITGEVHFGIHVFVDEVEAREAKSLSISDGIIVEVTAEPEDLVAAGSFSYDYASAVFMKVCISKKEWDRVMKENK